MQITQEKASVLVKPFLDGTELVPALNEYESALLEHANQTPVDMPLYLESLLARYVLEKAMPPGGKPARASGEHVRVVAEFNAQPFVLEDRCLTVNEYNALLPLRLRDSLSRTVLTSVEITGLSVNPLRAEYQIKRSEYTLHDLEEGFAQADDGDYPFAKLEVEGRVIFPSGGR